MVGQVLAPTTAGQRLTTRLPCSVLHAAAPPGAAQQAVTRVQFGACLRWVAFALRREMTSAPPKPPNLAHIEVLGPGPPPARGGAGALGPAARTAVSPRRGHR